MVIIDRSLHQQLDSLMGGRPALENGASRSLLCRVSGTADGGQRWVTGRTLRVAPGTRLAFRVTVGADEEVLWTGAREERFTLRTSVAVLCPSRRGTHVVAVEVYGPDRRVRETLSVEVDVA